MDDVGGGGAVESLRGFAQETHWGPRITDNGAEFRLWAPQAQGVELAIGSASGENDYQRMMQGQDGWWSLETDRVAVGGGYGFRIDGGTVVPDPAARAQMKDVHSLSKLVDPLAYEWRVPEWKGRPWEEVVFYELHTGTFTPEGTFDGVVSRLDYLKETGITAVEIMPVAEFGGTRGWGYDGTLLYCPFSLYGGVEGLKRLVDAAHERGLMVFLDVVYNHFGPDGNYLNVYAREFFHPEIQTPWGPAIAYDERPVRDFMIDNALYWLNEYRIDGLRLDAIDSIKDKSETDIIAELAARVRESFPDRHVHLTSEDARNITWHVERNPGNEPRLVSGEWNDDFHHCCHVVATRESEGYYADYAHHGVRQLARSLAEGFVFQGQYSEHRGDHVGHPSGHLPPTAFVNFIQNHDQIGNRAFGDRLTDLASRRLVECLQAILLLSPQIPLLFMGEEYGETRPFCFFTDFDGELGEAVSKGRREEFKNFAAFGRESSRQLIPDPNALTTFEQSRLDWNSLRRGTYALHRAGVAKLLGIRQERLVPLLKDMPPHCGTFSVSEGSAFEVCWSLGEGKALHLFANLDDEPWALPEELTRQERTEGEIIFSNDENGPDALAEGSLPPATVIFRLAERLQIEDATHD